MREKIENITYFLTVTIATFAIILQCIVITINLLK